MFFPKLPLLDQFPPQPRKQRILADIGLVCVQHLLETTGSLFEKLIELGFRPQNLHVLGKAYSTDRSVHRRLIEMGVQVHSNEARFEYGKYSNQFAKEIQCMWMKAAVSLAQRGVSRVVVLDDGGMNIATVPSAFASKIPTIGVEQTMSGIALNRNEPPPIPFISVGSSPAKVLIEPQIIQREVFTKVLPIVKSLRSKTVGVVGTGHIGRAIISGLLRAGANVLVNDRRVERLSGVRGVKVCELGVLYHCSEIIWGCSGSDHLMDQSWVEDLKGRKTLLSCSSKDIEFGTLLRTLDGPNNGDNKNRLSDVDVKIADWTAHIVRGGFPVNFDGCNESAPIADIQLTRALLLAGILQGTEQPISGNSGDMINLDPNTQAKLVARWFSLVPRRKLAYAHATRAFFGVDGWSERNVLNSTPICDLATTTN